MDRQERIAKARKLRARGYRLKDIAKDLGVSLATARSYCKGILPKNACAVSEEKQALMARFAKYYAACLSVPEISPKIGVPASTLYDWRRELGLPKNSRAMYFTEEMRTHLSRLNSRDQDGRLKAEAILLYLQKEWSTPEIAAKLNVTSVTVGQWLRGEGIELRREPTRRHRQKLSNALRGEKAHNWKGGITADSLRRRASRLCSKFCVTSLHYPKRGDA
jgi:transposase